jgi:hypothetical protein
MDADLPVRTVEAGVQKGSCGEVAERLEVPVQGRAFMYTFVPRAWRLATSARRLVL